MLNIHHFLFFSLFANLWIWKIFSFDLNIFILLVVFAVGLSIFLHSKSSILFVGLSVVLLVLFMFQYNLTEKTNLTRIDNSDRLRIDTRLRQYPPTYFQIGEKTIWIPLAHWFEERRESLIWRGMKNNIFRTLDINYYFFASHPNEQVGYKEFEKFPYIFLPFFILGCFLLTKWKKGILFIFLILPLIFTTFIGDKNPIGAFTIFPFVIVSIAFALENSYRYLIKKNQTLSKYAIVLFIVIAGLVLLQNYLYEIS